MDVKRSPGAEFEFNYLSAADLGNKQHQVQVTYVDDQGQLLFMGMDPGHSSGGALYFPSPEEWLDALPQRVGQRRMIFSRLMTHIRQHEKLACFERSLVERDFFARWPDELYLSRKHWALLASRNVRDADLHPWSEPGVRLSGAAKRNRLRESRQDDPFPTVVRRFRLWMGVTLTVGSLICIKACEYLK